MKVKAFNLFSSCGVILSWGSGRKGVIFKFNQFSQKPRKRISVHECVIRYWRLEVSYLNFDAVPCGVAT